MVYTCKWGILATGGIAESFTKDLLIDPATRKVSDVQHEVVAVASSSSVDKARDFVEKLHCPASTKCYGSYSELVSDANVKIIYIATPHSHHYENALECLNAGKSIICEKPFTVNAKQTEHILRVAKEKQLFAMEAVWTRCFPISIELQRMLFEDDIIGRIRKVITDFGVKFDLDDTKHRILNPELAGGALLDLGIYNITWTRMLCFNDPRNERQEPRISASMLMSDKTGVDEYTNIDLLFERSRVNATIQTNIVVKSAEDAVVRIQGDKGDITVQWPPMAPRSFTIYKRTESGSLEETGDKRTFDIPGGANGMIYEADECARCLRDGKLESALVPWSESIATMKIMDTAREQNNFKYPGTLENVHV